MKDVKPLPAGAPLRSSWTRTLADQQRSASVKSSVGCRVQQSASGSSIVVPSAQRPLRGMGAWDVHGYRFQAATLVLIRERSIRLHGIANVDVAEEAVNLSGDPCWVFVRLDRSNYEASPATLMCQSTEPTSNESFLNIPLYRFDLADGGGRYRLGRPCSFDIHFDAPIR